ncbi:MAG: hypothetical protein Q8N37_04400 [bacterium]|nr:hypothetical protein [bacterium]
MKEKAIKASKIILKGILLGGAVAIAATSPNFVQKILPKILKRASFEWKKYKNKKKFLNSFNYLKSSGLINMEYKGNQLYVSLTEEGKKKVKKYWIDDLKITKPEKWDGKWRIMIFDVKDKQKIKREALRGKIKELGLYQLQKSVWVCPYNFEKEAGILRDFFGFNFEEMKLIIASEIEGDGAIRQHFKL